MYTLSVSFPLDDRFQEITKSLERLLAKPRAFSGAGGGQRDIEFEFTNKTTAERAEARVRSVLSKYFPEGNVSVEVWTMDE